MLIPNNAVLCFQSMKLQFKSMHIAGVFKPFYITRVDVCGMVEIREDGNAYGLKSLPCCNVVTVDKLQDRKL